MKKTILTIFAIGALGAGAFYANKSTMSPTTAPSAKTAGVKSNARQGPGVASSQTAPKSPLPTALLAAKADFAAEHDFIEMVETTRSLQATFNEKNSAWQRLRDSGQLDHAISELEKQAAANPDSATTLAALGRGYEFKVATLQDLGQVAALGTKIDQTFAAALKVDPNNWDAQFYKAAALSSWPAFMNKGPEAVAGFQNLIQQQEAQAAQPQFANTYLLLGEQYQRQGNNDSAQQVWQHGAQLFPENDALKNKIGPQPNSQP